MVRGYVQYSTEYRTTAVWCGLLIGLVVLPRSTDVQSEIEETRLDHWSQVGAIDTSLHPVTRSLCLASASPTSPNPSPFGPQDCCSSGFLDDAIGRTPISLLLTQGSLIPATPA